MAWALTFDLGAATQVDSVTVDYSCNFLAKNAYVQVSDDGTTWTNVGLLPTQDPAYLAVSQSHRYLRLAMSGLQPDTGYTPAIREVDFNLGAPAAPLTCIEETISGGPSQSSNVLPLKAYDDNLSTIWQGSSTADAWQLTFDFRPPDMVRATPQYAV